MPRRTVLHVVQDWGAPDDAPVADLLAGTRSTRPVVAAQRVTGPVPAGLAVHDLGAVPGAVPRGAPYGRARLTTVLGTRVPGRPNRRTAVLAAVEGARVLHAHGGDSAWLAWRGASVTRARLAVSLAGPDLLVRCRDDEGMLAAMLAAHVVVAPSQFLADGALAIGVRHADLHVVAPALDVSRLPYRERGPHDGPLRIAFCGPFSERSGVLDCVQAVGILAAGRPVVARFVGHGPLGATLGAQVADGRLDVAVQDGTVPGAYEQAWDWADVAVLAARTAADGDAEPWGQWACQAQACGLPVVAARNGGLTQWAARDAMSLVPSHGDIRAALARALTELADRPQDWAGRGRAGRDYVARTLDPRTQTDRLEALWRELAARGPVKQLVGSLQRPPDQF